MYRLMLADDEGIVLDSLKMIIEKRFPGVFEIETAKSGREVIELAEQFRPEIAFMDIQMPGINGIDAMKEIQKNNPTIQFIVLSAYDKFDYAKESVNLGVLEYLTKPFKGDTIEEVLLKATRIIDAKRKKRRDDLLIREKLETVTPIIESGFVYATMFQDYFEEDIENYKSLLGMDAEYGCMLALVMGDEEANGQMVNTVGASVRIQGEYGKVRELVKETYTCVIGALVSNKIPVFIPRSEKKMSYEERIRMIDDCRELARKLKKATEVTFRVGIGSVRSLNEMMTSYEEALKVLREAKGSVVHVDDMSVHCDYEEAYPIELEKELFASLKKGNPNACEQAASHYFDWMIQSYPENSMSVRLKVLEFILHAERGMYENGGMTYHFSDRENYLDKVMSVSRNEELKEWFTNRFRECCTHMMMKDEVRANSLVDRAKEYIDTHFNRDLSLDEVSKQLDISPYYFSKLFKEETGENFVEYVTGLRIAKAKELLKEAQYSMKEICAEIGYSDPNYFSRIFKKNVGITPTEYRER